MGLPIIQYSPEPQLGEREIKEAADKQYKEPLPISLEEQKEGVCKALYSSNEDGGEEVMKKNIVEERREANNFNDTRELKIFIEHPYFPIINRFAEIDCISMTNSDMVELAKVFNDMDIEQIDTSILEEANISKESKTYLFNYMAKIEELNPKIETTKGEDIEIPKEFQSIEALQNKDSNIVQLLAQNYTRIPDGTDGTPNFSKDIETTFEITLNKVIENKEFPKTEGYELAVMDIKNGDIETKFQALTYIHSIVNTDGLLKGAKSKSSFEKIKGEHHTKKEKYLDFKIQKLKVQIKQTTEGKEKNKLEQELEKLDIIKEKDDFEGEVFISGEEDKQSEGNDTGGEQA